MRRTFGANAREAIGYFTRVLGLCRYIEPEQKRIFTEAVADLIHTFAKASDDFKRILEQEHPAAYAEVFDGEQQPTAYEIKN